MLTEHQIGSQEFSPALVQVDGIVIGGVYVGNAKTGMSRIPSNSVQQYITSPPYFRQRFYDTEPQIWGGDPNHEHIWMEREDTLHAGRGDSQRQGKYSEQDDIPDRVFKYYICDCGAFKGELGLELTLNDYIRDLVDIFKEAKRTLHPTGTLWVVIGDKRLPGKRWALIPQRLQIAMEEDGWIPCMEIIWHKTNPLPTSSPAMPKPDFEKILVFAKTENYYFDKEVIKQPLKAITIKRNQYPVGTFNTSNGNVGIHSRNSPKKITFIMNPAAMTDVEVEQPAVGGPKHAGKVPNRVYSGNKVKIHDGMANKGSVWSVSTQNRWRQEYCPACDLLRDKHDMFKRCQKCKNTEFDENDACTKCGGKIKELCCKTCSNVVHSHYALFPEALVELMVRSGSPRWVCVKCGKPYINIYSEKRIDTRPGKNTGTMKSGTPKDPNAGLHNSELSKKRQIIVKTPVGIEQGCKCKFNEGEIQKRPALIGDMFGGFGTTIVVAYDENRVGFMFDLDKRNARTAELRARPHIEAYLKNVAELDTIAVPKVEQLAWHP